MLYEAENIWEGLEVRQAGGDGVQPETASAVLYPYACGSTAGLHRQGQHVLGVSAIPHQERALRLCQESFPSFTR